MVWKKQSTDTDVTVDLGDFNVEQLLQHLIDGDYITEVEAEMIMNREDLETDVAPIPGVDTDCIEQAWNLVIRGDKHEALVWIERALGGEWIGRLA